MQNMSLQARQWLFTFDEIGFLLTTKETSLLLDSEGSKKLQSKKLMDEVTSLEGFISEWHEISKRDDAAFFVILASNKIADFDRFYKKTLQHKLKYFLTTAQLALHGVVSLAADPSLGEGKYGYTLDIPKRSVDEINQEKWQLVNFLVTINRLLDAVEGQKLFDVKEHKTFYEAESKLLINLDDTVSKVEKLLG